ncbi:MAG: hypothetical protein KYX69_22380 [Sphingomonas sp.]|uniref:hypothetical protein n=1 Tax=Sphingomonas sp. TaxID=28214 RepID=UPI002615FD22|nr:hypothetical protein [Sphingomonas sp.]MDK2770453.1 hypothetical protein [Sphingomonas sp.]
MSVFHRVLDRIADWRWTGRKINLRFVAEYRTACFALPIINGILAEDEDGETFRAALTDWRRAERPPLALYHGETSFCRIDGPRQWVKDRSFPLGGLILSPGVTAHLDPFEARELQEHMEWAIEQAIRQWIADHDLHDLSPVPVEFGRRKADRKAKAKIADWVARQERIRPVADDDAEGPDHG